MKKIISNIFVNILFFIYFSLQPHFQPEYSSCLLFELHKTKDGYHVELLYKRKPGSERQNLTPIYLPKCGRAKCPLDKFISTHIDIIPDKDYDTECGNFN